MLAMHDILVEIVDAPLVQAKLLDLSAQDETVHDQVLQ